DHAHTRKNEKHQGRYQLDCRLGRRFLRLLTALRTKGVRKIAQRFRDGSSKSIGLDEHCHKRTSAFEIGSLREGLQCGVAMHDGALLKVNQQQFFAEFAMADTQLLANSHNALVESESRFQADGQ